MSELKGFKLVSGEEIVAREVGFTTNPDKYHLERPRMLIPQSMGNQLTIGMVPWVLGADGNVTVELPASAVVIPYTPHAELEREYVRQTTGLQLVTG